MYLATRRITRTPEETEDLGECIGRRLRAGDIVCLSGALGAGKTCLVRGIARGWGSEDVVTSPSFVLANAYHRASDPETLYHLDCYRLRNADDAETIGLDDLLNADGAVVIEWPERILETLPAERLWITITCPDDAFREITLETESENYRRLTECG